MANPRKRRLRKQLKLARVAAQGEVILVSKEAVVEVLTLPELTEEEKAKRDFGDASLVEVLVKVGEEPEKKLPPGKKKPPKKDE